MSNHNKIKSAIKELESINEAIGESALTQKYDTMAKSVTFAHYGLFISVIWKSLELDGVIPICAKLSLLFFGIGIVFSALRYIADYFSTAIEQAPHYKRLIQIEEQYGETIQKEYPDIWSNLHVVNRMMIWAMTKTDNFHPALASIVYFLIDATALLISFVLLTLGLILLGLSAV